LRTKKTPQAEIKVLRASKKIVNYLSSVATVGGMPEVIIWKVMEVCARKFFSALPSYNT
jgi:hypothetical protein